MKSLKPTMRERKRYLLVQGEIKEIEEAILEFVGILGMSKVGLNWIKRDRNSAIISINRKSLDLVRASFSIWPNILEVKRVSGTLKGLNNK
jgi:RNase P/RNase MRP subunit POP5